MSVRRAALVLVSLAAASCAGDGSQLPDDMMGTPEPTLTWIQSNLFGQICVNCHVPGGVAEFMPLNTASASFTSLVGQESVEVGPLLRVSPGDPDASYLVWKIEGQGPAGEPLVGERMPPPSAGEPALPDEQIAAIREWILDGAPP